MAKVNVNLSGVQERLKETFKKASEEDELLNDLGETAVKNMVAEARLGRDPNTGEKFPDFADNTLGAKDRYIARRRAIASSIGKGRSFKPAKSNMTLSGQLLLSVGYTIKNGRVIVEPSDSPRRAYGNETPPTNKELARWHRDGAGSYEARNIIGVSDKTEETLVNKVRAYLRRNLLNR